MSFEDDAIRAAQRANDARQRASAEATREELRKFDEAFLQKQAVILEFVRVWFRQMGVSVDTPVEITKNIAPAGYDSDFNSYPASLWIDTRWRVNGRLFRADLRGQWRGDYKLEVWINIRSPHDDNGWQAANTQEQIGQALLKEKEYLRQNS